MKTITVEIAERLRPLFRKRFPNDEMPLHYSIELNDTPLDEWILTLEDDVLVILI